MKSLSKKTNLTLSNFLSPERCHNSASDKSARKIFEHIAETFCSCLDQANKDDIFLSFLKREQLGSTAIGEGVAIPHCRSAHTDTMIGCLITLEKPIDLHAEDEQDVDIILAIIAPEESSDEDSESLKKLAEILRKSTLTQRLRHCKNSNELYQSLLQYQDIQEAI